MSKITAVPCDNISMLASLSTSTCELRITAYNVAGMIKDAVETAIREDMVEATVPLKLCSL